MPLLHFIPGRIQELLLHLLGKFSRFIYLFIYFFEFVIKSIVLVQIVVLLCLSGTATAHMSGSAARNRFVYAHEWPGYQKKKTRKYAWVNKSNVFRYKSGSATVLRFYNWTNVFGTCHEAIVGLG